VLRSGPDWWVKIADFGISKRTEASALRTVVGTEAYLAPEVRGIYTMDAKPEDADVYSLAVDMWSVGAIAFQMLAGRSPFPDGLSLFHYVVSSSPFPMDGAIGTECADFVRKTMAASPRHRPTAGDALAHPWVAGQSAALILEAEPSTRYSSMAVYRITSYRI